MLLLETVQMVTEIIKSTLSKVSMESEHFGPNNHLREEDFNLRMSRLEDAFLSEMVKTVMEITLSTVVQR